MAKRLLRRRGLEVRRVTTPTRSFSAGVENLRRFVAPATIIDIGVAKGTPDLYRHFPSQPYLLVEANPAYAADLEQLAGRLDAVVANVFCGPEAGTATLNVYPDASKSSRFEVARDLEPSNEIEVPVQPLDALVEEHRLRPPYLIKIDVEGAEIDVIAGAGKTLGETEAVIAEASIATRFQGGAELVDLVGAMSDHGFSVFDVLSCFDFPEPGRLYQADLVFVKSDAAFRQPRR